jgi:ABC-2 type transport system permease protein
LNILNITIKEMKQDFRDVKTFIFMLAFPIVLMLILGSALTNAYSGNMSTPDIHVLYQDKTNGEISRSFGMFTKEIDKSGIHFTRAPNKVDGKEEVKHNNYDGYVEITKTGIQFYGSDRNQIEGHIIQGVLSAFINKYNLVAEVGKHEPHQVNKVIGESNPQNYVAETALNATKQPGSMDYYAISMTTMIILYGAISASYLIRGERARNTALRLAASPITKVEIFSGKILGNIVSNAFCVIIVVLFSKYVFKVNWGDHLGLVFLVLVSEVVLATSFGLGISYITKTGETSKMIVMIVVQLASFFGGAYYKVVDAQGIMKVINHLSPLTWENASIIKIIYTNDTLAAIPAITLNFVVSVLFLAIAMLALRRREGL